MKKLFLIIALFLVVIFAKGQTFTEIRNLPGLIQVTVRDQINKEIGFFQFDSASGNFIRRGNQTIVFREYIKFLHTDGELLTAAKAVLQHIRENGTISNPIEFLEALGYWYFIKSKWGLL